MSKVQIQERSPSRQPTFGLWTFDPLDFACDTLHRSHEQSNSAANEKCPVDQGMASHGAPRVSRPSVTWPAGTGAWLTDDRRSADRHRGRLRARSRFLTVKSWFSYPRSGRRGVLLAWKRILLPAFQVALE